MRSANEEVLSSDEELQSSNEELETANEELESGNEELTTVNEQLHQRNLELSQANNDFANLLSSTGIPLVVVGSDLRIRHFTPPARRTMNLLPADVGRPIGDIRPAIAVDDLESLIRKVVETVQPLRDEVRDRNGKWHALRIYPYRTADNRIDGAVVVLVDIDDIRRTHDLLQQQTAMRKKADQRKNELLAMLQQQTGMLKQADQHNNEFLAMLGHEFIVRLPLAGAAPAAGADLNDDAASSHREVQPRRVLIIEDNIDQAQMLAALLALWGHEVKMAHEGAAGIELAQEFLPDVALVDLGLPGVSGYEVARRMKAHPKLKHIRLIAQTGWGQAQDRQRAREAGFDHHLLKPLDPEELTSLLATIEPRRPATD